MTDRASDSPDETPTTRGWHRLWWVVAAVSVLGLGVVLTAGLRFEGTGEGAATGPATQVKDEAAAPLAGRTLDGGRFDLADLRGQVVVVNVWASWCAPCREELPLLAETARQWSGKGLSVVGLNVRDKDAAARQMLAETGAENLTVVTDPEGTLAVDWGVVGVPETFVVDRDGHVRVRAMGVVTRQWLDQHVLALVRS